MIDENLPADNLRDEQAAATSDFHANHQGARPVIIMLCKGEFLIN